MLTTYRFAVYLKNGDVSYCSYKAKTAQGAIDIMKRAYKDSYKRFEISY